MISFYNRHIDRFYFSLAGNGLRVLLPIHSGISVLSHFGQLVRLRGRSDLYHVTDGALSVIARLKHPTIVTVHDVISFLNLRDKSATIQDLVMRRSMRHLMSADRILVDSHHTQRELERVLGLNMSKVSVVPLGVDHDLFRPIDKRQSRMRLRLPLDKKIILNVGSEEPRKNVPTLLRAFAKVVRNMPNTILIRVGAQESKDVARLISSNDLSKNVSYYNLSRMDLPYLYCAADALILPSSYEGFGFPVLESMACGCPVIASNTTSIPEIVGKAGILLDPTDCDALAGAIEDLLANPDLQDNLVHKGLEQSRKFSWTMTANKTLEVYREVLSKNAN
jgi:glycosyltransferase involved in cell wall biosynthesis